MDDIIATVNAQIETINQWVNDHGMALNPIKMKAIIIGPKNLIIKIIKVYEKSESVQLKNVRKNLKFGSY